MYYLHDTDIATRLQVEFFKNLFCTVLYKAAPGPNNSGFCAVFLNQCYCICLAMHLVGLVVCCSNALFPSCTDALLDTQILLTFRTEQAF